MSRPKGRRITKRAFEAMLIGKYGFDNIVSSPYHEDNYDGSKPKKLTLYYHHIHGHCATWMSGEGWEV